VVLYSCRGRSEGQTAFRVSLDDRPCLFQSVMKKKSPPDWRKRTKDFLTREQQQQRWKKTRKKTEAERESLMPFSISIIKIWKRHSSPAITTTVHATSALYTHSVTSTSKDFFFKKRTKIHVARYLKPAGGLHIFRSLVRLFIRILSDVG
jgi:uncharacterized protein (DUF2267 family)